MYTARIVTLMLTALLWQSAAHADLDDIRRTAEAGDREAQLELGILFQYGFNYKDNEIPALTWYSLSANQGNARAVGLRDALKAKMTEKEVQEAMEQVATFKPKGTLRNVAVVATFPAVPTGAGITFMVTKNDANSEYVQNLDYAVSPRHTTAYARLTLNTPGKYLVRMANYHDKSQVWGTASFTVGEDTVGPRATGNTAAGQGKVSICKEIDDNWKCVGDSNEWKANAPFNVNFENPTPSGVDFIGISFTGRVRMAGTRRS